MGYLVTECDAITNILQASLKTLRSKL